MIGFAHELLTDMARRWPDRVALTPTVGRPGLDYGSLATRVIALAGGLQGLGLGRHGRVAVWLDKRADTVTSLFGAIMAGGIVVPINPLLRPDQVVHVLRDCGATSLVTSADRLATLTAPGDHGLPGVRLRQVLLAGTSENTPTAFAGAPVLPLGDVAGPWRPATLCDSEPAALFYTSGSTGRSKGVVVSHRNLVLGAASVADYLENTADDVLLAALPLAFDAGFSQLTTAFLVGARVVLLNYLLPADVLNALQVESVTGLTAVPPLWAQLATLSWPAESTRALRFWACTGGRLPRPVLDALRARVPQARPFLMYGLTEAFRSTYLPPGQVDQRPGSIGKAIPHAEVLVLREDGTECDPDEPGELVHRGPLVAQGYWNDPEKTAERFRPLPPALRTPGLVLPEIVVFSGDTVQRDAEGYLYFVGRRDEMIKTSGYRVSPTEVEESLYASGLVGECAAFGVPHDVLGHVVHVVATPPVGQVVLDVAAVLANCRQRLPGYMVPATIEPSAELLPRNANGKIDRKALAASRSTVLGAR